VGRLTLAVLLVVFVRVFETLLAMLDAPPEPQPARTRTRRRMPADATLTRFDRTAAVILMVVALSGTRRTWTGTAASALARSYADALSCVYRDPEQQPAPATKRRPVGFPSSSSRAAVRITRCG
jgi:hypothetical protein